MNLDHLRERTRPQHQATEALMPLTSPGLTRPQYAAYLAALYFVLAPWERYAAAYAPAGLEPLVAPRRRAGLLQLDLHSLGAGSPYAGPSPAGHIPGLPCGAVAAEPAGFLGAMYVVEGSSLGGQYLARSLEATLGLTADFGAAYFQGYGDNTGPLWAQFKAVLAALPDAAEDRVVAAAAGMFDLFAAALRSVPVMHISTA